MATLESLASEQAQQTDLFNRLRKEGADPSQLEDVKKRIQELKKEIGALKAADGATGGAAGKKKERLLLKTPKVCALASPAMFTTLTRHRVPVTMDPARCTRASTSSAS